MYHPVASGLLLTLHCHNILCEYHEYAQDVDVFCHKFKGKFASVSADMDVTLRMNYGPPWNVEMIHTVDRCEREHDRGESDCATGLPVTAGLFHAADYRQVRRHLWVSLIRLIRVEDTKRFLPAHWRLRQCGVP
jgi:hypothetical protein